VIPEISTYQSSVLMNQFLFDYFLLSFVLETNLSKDMYVMSHISPQFSYKSLKKWIAPLFIQFPFTHISAKTASSQKGNVTDMVSIQFSIGKALLQERQRAYNGCFTVTPRD
jgi:hypothetical protein